MHDRVRERVPDEELISVEMLIDAYKMGVFPMAMPDGEIGWFSPEVRGVIPLDAFHVPHGLKRTLKKEPFEIRYDTAFEEVVRGCAAREETWIDEVILQSYVRLHRRGHAHSVEAWREGKLVGGLYGVAIGAAFFGESMFSRETDASKVALVYLVERLNRRAYQLLDTQWTTPHLKRFGCREMLREDYMGVLEEAVGTVASFG